MNVDLSCGQSQVVVMHSVTEPPAGLEQGLRTTTVNVLLPGGETLTGKVSCHTGDQFVKRAGRFYALMKLLDADTDQAIEIALAEHKSEIFRQPETDEGLASAAKKHYKLSRADRTKVFNIVCPEFTRNTPARRAQREKALYERLKAKYEPKKKSRAKKVVVDDTAPPGYETGVNMVEVPAQQFLLDEAAK